MKNKLIAKSLAALTVLTALGGGAGVAALASAQVSSASGATAQTAGMPQDGQRGPGVMGTIASISGTAITVTGRNNTTYPVDASAATVHVAAEGAAPTTGTVASLKVGDMVGVRGTVTGTNVAATDIMSGMMHGFGPGGRGKGPGVHGTVSAINGNTLTITNTDGTSYTVDASAAEVSKMTTLSVSDIKVGDTVGVEGTVSGTSVTAKHIMDGVPPKDQQ